MDSFHQPSALSFHRNTSENWRRFKKQYKIYLTASGSEKKDDSIKIAIFLNFAGEDAIEVFNTFQFPEGDENNKITLADVWAAMLIIPLIIHRESYEILHSKNILKIVFSMI